MKSLKLISVLFIAAIVIAGCATEKTIAPAVPAQTNAITGAVTPATPAQTVFVPNQSLATIAQIATTAAPVVPEPFNELLLAALGLATTVSTVIAKRANDQKNAHADAAAALASVVAAVPELAKTAMNNAKSNDSTQLVAQHLSDAASPT